MHINVFEQKGTRGKIGLIFAELIGYGMSDEFKLPSPNEFGAFVHAVTLSLG
jgi:hypothetical protein